MEINLENIILEIEDNKNTSQKMKLFIFTLKFNH